MDAVVRVLVTALALWVAVQVLPGLTYEGSALGLVGIAVVIGVVNAFVRPLITFLSLPLVLVTLGAFLVVVNAVALTIALAVSRAFGAGLTSAGFGWTLLAALVLSVVSAVVGRVVRP